MKSKRCPASQATHRKIDPCGIRALLQLGGAPPPWIAIQGVKPRATNMWYVAEKSFKTSRYWKLPAPKNGHHRESPEQIVACQRDRLLESKYQQTMSDAPVALSYAGV